MCGIIGYLGPKNAVDIIIEGLSRLEYRGYDSAGISLVKDHQNAILVLKKEGKLQNLQNLLLEKKLYANLGIGHTRWATHGGVNDTNAHPHATDKISIVHNGIVENAHEIKKKLKDWGSDYQFKSETDSEVFLALLHYFNEKNPKMPFLEVIATSFKEIRGNSAFVITKIGENKLYAIKRSAPLVAALGDQDGEAFISSDAYALVGLSSHIYFPQDEVIVECVFQQAKAKLNFYELNLKSSSRFQTQFKTTTLDQLSKGSFEHYMLKEIHEQPHLIRELAQYYLRGEGREILENLSKQKPREIHVTACGTAYHAGLVIKNYIEEIAQIPVHVYLASEFRYHAPLMKADDWCLFISQSGETADTLACLEMCNEKKLKTITIVNVEGSTIFRTAQNNLLIRAGAEIGVASTKAFTLMGVTGFFLALSLSQKLLTPLNGEADILANRIDEMLEKIKEIQDVSAQFHHAKGFLFTGRGHHFPIALEGALKIKEIAYVHAEGYASGELKHGPIALIDDAMVNIALCPPHLFEKSFSNLQEVKARRGMIFAIGSFGQAELEESNAFLPLNYQGLSYLDGLYSNVVLQLFSYFVAKLKGTDIDKPRNLAKSVTVE